MYLRSIIFTLIALLALPANADRFEPMGGIYLDSFSGFSAKIGSAYTFEPENASTASSRFFYSDVELGTKARKIAFGYGAISSAATIRLGLSLAREEGDNFIGLESVGNIWLMTIKIGAYNNTSTSDKVLSFGVGIGF